MDKTPRIRDYWHAQPDFSYIHHPDFENVANHRAFLAPMPRLDEYRNKLRTAKIPANTDAVMAHSYLSVLLEPDQEYHCFRQFNLLKYKFNVLKAKYGLTKYDDNTLTTLCEQISSMEHLIINANLRLATKFAGKVASRWGTDLGEVLSRAYDTLMRAAACFDFGKGFKFSTYATTALQLNFRRPPSKGHSVQAISNADEALELVCTQETECYDQDICLKLRNALRYLQPDERQVVNLRYMSNGSVKTFAEIGRIMDRSRARIQQIDRSAIGKLKELMDGNSPQVA